MQITDHRSRSTKVLFMVVANRMNKKQKLIYNDIAERIDITVSYVEAICSGTVSVGDGGYSLWKYLVCKD